MGLSAGTRLGPYEIVAPLGAGGMGEVYRARDTRLGRDVAVKVLPTAFLEDAELLSRFEREARALAAVNHPGIAAIYSFEAIEGQRLLVMELAEGEPLNQRLKAGTIHVDEALAIARQIAEALEAAHERGIVHRDLKPANVVVSAEGKVKLLDFGLAKAFDSDPSSPEISHSPTLTARGTATGVILGTAAYMSPEQARGRPVDKRADIWAFGVVLYEMLSGKRLFRGETVSDTLASVLREPVDWAQLPASTPRSVRNLLERCLDRDPKSRLRDIGEARVTLEHPSSSAFVVGTGLDSAGSSVRRWRPWAIAALAAALGLFVGLRFARSGSPPAPHLSLSLSFPLDAAPDTGTFTLTPDGKALVYAGSKLFVRRLDHDEIRPIPGTEGAEFPFISPDGLDVGFFAEGKLKKVSLAGGSPITLCDAPGSRGGSWGVDGTIVFVPSPMSGLWRIPASGGEVRRVTTPDAAKSEYHYFPQILPDGEHVVFAIMDRDWASRAAVVSLRTDEQRIIVEDAAYPRYLPTGHLVFTRPGSLFAVPFSLKRLETSSPPIPLLDDLVTNYADRRNAALAFSEEGTLVYVPTRQLRRTLVWVDWKGVVERIPFPLGGYATVALSPDGGRLAGITVEKGENMALLIGDFARGTLSRSAAEGFFSKVVWAPDGKQVAFGLRQRGKFYSTFLQSADGSTPPEHLTSETILRVDYPTSFSPDGSLLLLNVYNYTDTSPANTGDDIFVLPLSGERTLRPFLQTRFDEREARFSPDGRWVAYQSNESGRYEVFVRPYTAPGGKWQISTEGGSQPRWSPSGRGLFYRQEDKMMIVDVETKPTFRPGRPRTLFEGPYLEGYDVAPDGTRFLMIKPDPAESGPAHVNVVLNWFEEVKRRVPGAK